MCVQWHTALASFPSDQKPEPGKAWERGYTALQMQWWTSVPIWGCQTDCVFETFNPEILFEWEMSIFKISTFLSQLFFTWLSYTSGLIFLIQLLHLKWNLLGWRKNNHRICHLMKSVAELLLWKWAGKWKAHTCRKLCWVDVRESQEGGEGKRRDRSKSLRQLSLR